MLTLLKYKKFADDVISHDDNDLGDKLYEHLVEAQPGDEYGEDDLLCHKGQDSSAVKRHDLLKKLGAILHGAVENPGAVCDVLEGHNKNPADHVRHKLVDAAGHCEKPEQKH